MPMKKAFGVRHARRKAYPEIGIGEYPILAGLLELFKVLG
jgi:hypothetical protein